MEHMTVNNIVEAVHGRLLCGNPEFPLTHISIDSRDAGGACHTLFVPLIGEKVDAHQFIGQALSLGMGAVLTSEHDFMESDRAFIRVEDTKKALQDIGRYYRKRLTLPLVGVTGSVGKTTTREMIATALEAGMKVYRTKENKNSQVGVPITITEITQDQEIGVIELGMSEPGELTVIARIAQVDMAVITNVGITHIEQLGSQENIYKEKLSIQDGLKPGGTLFLNGDDELLKHTKAREGFRTVYFGTGSNCDYRAVDIRLEEGYPCFTAVHGQERANVRLGIMGSHHIGNAMVSLAVARENGIPMEEAAKKLRTFTGFQNRQQIYECHGWTVIDDSYNASPVSMKAAIDVLCSMEHAKRRIAVLADMKELGEEASKYHYEIGTYLGETSVDLVLLLGDLAREIAAGVKDTEALTAIHTFDHPKDLTAFLKEQIKPGDCVLFKGSNSMKLGQVCAHFIRED